MKFRDIDRYLTGLSVPVSALRSSESCGVGEFADLPLLGRFCAKAGLDVIQILPVNDTGANSSPYSALSAYALHPLYLRLGDLPGAAAYSAEMSEFRRHAEERTRFSYPEVLAFKISVAERIFAEREPAIRKDRKLSRWIDANRWVISYAVFKTLKDSQVTEPGRALPSFDETLVSETWKSNESRCLFHAWIQFQLEAQLSSASKRLEEMGVRLKGDIPILMSEDSADVWGSPRYFDRSFRAGAPPDMYSRDGQNWRFPVYAWDALARDDYAWWKGRLLQAAKFFHAFRIDHVLGFFRIWCIPRTERRGLLGRFSPVVPMARDALRNTGFDDGRIRWLSAPHFRGAEIEARLGADAERIRRLYLLRVGDQELFNLRAEMDGEEAILALNEPEAVKDFLLSKHVDRALIAVSEEEFVPSWFFWQTTSFTGMSQEEQAKLREAITASRAASERIWEQRGRELLGMLRETTDMLVCAEDLGDVPDCVPRVLSDLGILGLRVARWARDYKAPGAPFIPEEGFPRLTVCTASVHDTSTLRGWWEESPAEREAYFRHSGFSGACPERLNRGLLLSIVSRLMGAGSLLCVFQLQDLLDLEEANWSADPREDRINVPGTVNEKNWTWRMPLTVESLAERSEPAAAIRALTSKRQGRILS